MNAITTNAHNNGFEIVERTNTAADCRLGVIYREGGVFVMRLDDSYETYMLDTADEAADMLAWVTGCQLTDESLREIAGLTA